MVVFVHVLYALRPRLTEILPSVLFPFGITGTSDMTELWVYNFSTDLHKSCLQLLNICFTVLRVNAGYLKVHVTSRLVVCWGCEKRKLTVLVEVSVE
jgi:hypothetical protein